jgi:Tol biopolymer transport system component
VDWSPDGRFLAVTDRAKDSTWGIALVSVETGETAMLTTNTEETTADFFPAFSPDGRRLAFFRASFVGGTSDLHVRSLSRDEPPRVEGDAILMKGVQPGPIAWLPGGDEILAGTERVALDGSPPRPLTLPEWRSAHEWEPSGFKQQRSVRGTKLAFDTAGLRGQLLRVSLAGATKAVPAPFFASSRGEEDPAFAPDGRRVAFTSLRSGDRRIWIGEADGSACRELPLPSGSRYPGSPSWSPDGRRLAFDAGLGGQDHVYITTPEGGTLRRLTSERMQGARPRWSRDGRSIYLASTRGGGDWQLWRVRADADDPDADAVQVTRSGGMEAEESPDGTYLYYAKRQVRGVFRVPLGAWGAPEEKVLDLGGEGRWRLTARGILVLDLESGQRPTIRIHDFATGTTSSVLEVPVAPEWDIPTLGGAFTISPDERSALVGTLQIVESDIMLLDGFR